MATTENSYTAAANQTLFSFTFPYIDTTDIKVSVDSVVQTITTHYTLASATQIQFVAAPGVGKTVRIYRVTNTDTKKATFFSGSAIRSQDLNEDFDQSLYAMQEVSRDVLNIWDDTTETLTSAETFIDSDSYIMTAAAIEDRIAAGSPTISGVPTLRTDGGNDMVGHINLDNQKEMRWYEADANGANYIGWKAPAAVTTTRVFTLPDGFPGGSGYSLVSDTSGVMTWSSVGSPTTTAGDVIYRGASTDARLAKGTAGQVLQMNSGATAPEWGAPSSASVVTTAGDILFRDGSGLQRLAKGAAGQLLTMNSGATAPEWAAAAAAGYTKLVDHAAVGTGTSYTVTGVPSSARHLVILFSGMSFGGADEHRLRFGTSGGIVTADYFSSERYADSGVTTHSRADALMGYGTGVASRAFTSVVNLWQLHSTTWFSDIRTTTSQLTGANTAQIYDSVGWTDISSGTLDRFTYFGGSGGSLDSGACSAYYI